jgi:hypothetical protein
MKGGKCSFTIQSTFKRKETLMWNTPSREQLDRIPKLYETDHIPVEEKIIYLHFFIGGCDWYVSEYDGDDLFFGFAILNGDYENAEWGYISFAEMKAIQIHGLEIDCETDWTPKKASEIENIRIAQGWNQPVQG